MESIDEGEDEDEDDWDLLSECDTACFDEMMEAAWEEWCAEEPTLCAELEEAYGDEDDWSEDDDEDEDEEEEEDEEATVAEDAEE